MTFCQILARPLHDVYVCCFSQRDISTRRQYTTVLTLCQILRLLLRAPPALPENDCGVDDGRWRAVATKPDAVSPAPGDVSKIHLGAFRRLLSRDQLVASTSEG